MKVYYFGCWGESGHFLWAPDGSRDYTAERTIPWYGDFYDCCPGHLKQSDPRYSFKRVTAAQIEGNAALHHKSGWTALGFWDCSVDKRYGCVSVFFAQGTYGPAAMLEVVRQHFPGIWARYDFEVRIVERPNDVENPQHVCSICGIVRVGAVLDGWVHDPPGWFRRGDALACSVACVTRR